MKVISTMCVVLALLGSVSAVAGDYVIHAGRLIDGNSSKAMEQMSVIVKDQQIAGIEKGYVAAADGQEVIELMTDVKFVMKDGVVYKNEFALETK